MNISALSWWALRYTGYGNLLHRRTSILLWIEDYFSDVLWYESRHQQRKGKTQLGRVLSDR